MKNKKTANTLPSAVLQSWVKLNDSLPRLSIWGLDVSLTMATSLFLGIFRYIGEFLMVSIFGWPANSMVTKTAAASVPSILHSSLLVPSLFMTFQVHPYRPSESLDAAPVGYQKAAICLLQFCTGYMVYDAVLNVVWLNVTMGDGIQGDALMYLVHHAVTTLYMTLCRVHRAGHMSAFICMFLGEMTNPLHNAYFIAIAAQDLDCCNGPRSQKLYYAIEFMFGLSYFTVRAIIAPVFFLHASFSLWWDRNPKVPIATLCFWTFLIWLVEFGSISYIQKCWGMILKYTTTDEVSQEL